MQQVAVLGSTGSIGTSCLDVIGALSERLRLRSIAARSNWQLLSRQANRFAPRYAVLSDATLAATVGTNGVFGQTEVLYGAEGICRIVSDPEVDTVVVGIVGSAGLEGTWTALEAGKRVCIANKETLVVAGPLVMNLARLRNAAVLPVDSEHSAIFQAIQSGRPTEVARVVLTASGGPFRSWRKEALEKVTPEKALAHPTWNMGRKITIDSATMMNKALEVIEARWLFDLRPEQIMVVVHPQSIVHSMVEFIDGSVVAQLSLPDMKLPIQYSLTWPERVEGLSPRLNWSEALRLEFEPPNLETFPALQLGFEVARRGGTCGAVLNAANEAAVERFLNGSLKFIDIPRACRAVLDAHCFDPSPALADLLRLDRWAREEIASWKS